jgi:transcriptional regulator with XRE-family HTH domain
MQRDETWQMPVHPKESQLVQVFATNVRERRLALGFSQEMLAEAAGVHRTYVGMIERAEKNVTIYNIERIARALDVHPASLLIEGG